MADESKQNTATTAVIETATRAKNRVLPQKIGGVSVPGMWRADKNNPAVFLLNHEGGGKEVLKAEDGMEYTNDLKWELKGDNLFITTTSDREYVHAVTAHLEMGGYWTEHEGEWYQCFPLRTS